MAWFERFHRQPVAVSVLAPLDLENTLKEGHRDPASAKDAIARLTREQQHLTSQQRAIEQQMKKLSPVRIRNMARSGTALDSYELSQAMENANAANQDSAVGEQIATIESRRREVDRALLSLREYQRESRNR